MKSRILLFPVLIIILSGFALFHGKIGSCMAVEFDGSTFDQVLKFANAWPKNSKIFTVMMVLKADAFANNRYIWNFDAGGSFFDEGGAGNVLRLVVDGWTTTDGIWTWAYPSTGVEHHLAVSYDGSLTTNDPELYIDGVVQGRTETLTPAGTWPDSGTDYNIFVGGLHDGLGTLGFDGRILSFLVYNRILSASEIADAYNSKLAIPTYRGLVFAPLLCGAAGLQTFDGATLAAGNVLKDNVFGFSGVPSGSPIGRGDIYLTHGGG